jgi:hypothetical protein
MNARRIGMVLTAALTGLAFGVAAAKLPPPTDEQKAKAEEAKTKAADAAKKEAELLGKYQDRAADNYKRNKGVVKTGGTVTPAKK